MADGSASGDRLSINTGGVSHETIDGETLIINLENGNYYSLRGVAADIWGLLARGATASGISDAVERRYSGAREDIDGALGRFLADLQAEGLILTDPDGDASGRTGAGDQPQMETLETKRPFEAPVLQKYTDMQDLLLLDPIHEVDEAGWPTPKRAVEK